MGFLSPQPWGKLYRSRGLMQKCRHRVSISKMQ
jgi:hypothetical protein